MQLLQTNEISSVAYNLMNASQARDLLEDLLRGRSREENRHFEDSGDVTLKSRDVDCPKRCEDVDGVQEDEGGYGNL